MIDFPASPSLNQIFTAPTGITYRWTGTLWIAVGASAGGDFCAVQTSGFAALTTTTTTLLLNQILSGNSGGWYNPANGRFTPPAGRYCISCGMSARNTTTAYIRVLLRKNGTLIASDEDTTGAAAFSANPKLELTIDANGSDWFDVQADHSAGTSTIINQSFTAFPISGIQGPPGPPGSVPTGDFFAGVSSSGISGSTLILPVITGNSSGSYNATNGRFTPPAGRYFIFSWAAQALTTGPTTLTLSLRKNGTAVIAGTDSSAAAGFWVHPQVSGVYDANGTDWFDVQGSSTGGATNVNGWLAFGAYPISGTKGPQGDPGQLGWRLLQRVVPTAGQANIDFTNLPSDINDLQLTFDVIPTANVQDLILQFTNLSTSNYASSLVLSSSGQAVGAAPVVSSFTGLYFVLSYAAAGNRVSSNASAGGIRGQATVPSIRDTARAKGATWTATYLNDGLSAVNQVSGGGTYSPAGAISGLRLSWGATTFAAGGAVSLWGSP
jgi:hypothetical protein